MSGGAATWICAASRSQGLPSAHAPPPRPWSTRPSATACRVRQARRKGALQETRTGRQHSRLLVSCRTFAPLRIRISPLGRRTLSTMLRPSGIFSVLHAQLPSVTAAWLRSSLRRAGARAASGSGRLSAGDRVCAREHAGQKAWAQHWALGRGPSPGPVRATPVGVIVGRQVAGAYFVAARATKHGLWQAARGQGGPSGRQQPVRTPFQTRLACS